MNSEWTNKLQTDINAETPLHKSTLTKVKVTMVVFDKEGSLKWDSCVDQAVAEGNLNVDEVVAKCRAVVGKRCRLVGACLLAFDLDHEEILDGVENSMVTIDLTGGGEVSTPKVIPRFQDLTEMVLFFKVIELVPTRRVRLVRTGKRAQTRRIPNSLKPAA